MTHLRRKVKKGIVVLRTRSGTVLGESGHFLSHLPVTMMSDIQPFIGDTRSQSNSVGIDDCLWDTEAKTSHGARNVMAYSRKGHESS